MSEDKSNNDGCSFQILAIAGLIYPILLVLGKAKFEIGLFSINLLILLVAIPLALGFLFHGHKSKEELQALRKDKDVQKEPNPIYKFFMVIIGIVLVLGGVSLLTQFYLMGVLPLMIGLLLMGIDVTKFSK